MAIQFVAPIFLWFSALALVPLILHLIKLKKYQKVYFSDISLLEEIEISSRSKKKIKDILLLICRMIALIALACLFAQPYIPNNKQYHSEASVVIFIEDAPVTLMPYSNSTLLSEAKNIAEKIIDSYPTGTAFKIIHYQQLQEINFPLSGANAKDKIASIKANNAWVNWDKVSDRMSAEIKNETQSIHWVSTFNTLTEHFDWEQFGVEQYFYPLKSSLTYNLSVDSIYFKYPIRSVLLEDSVFIQISANSSEENETMRYRNILHLNGQEFLSGGMLQANQSKTIKQEYTIPTSATIKARVSLEGDIFNLDNERFFTYPLKEKLTVLLITENTEIATYLKAVYATEDKITLSTKSPSNCSVLAVEKADLIIIAGFNRIPNSLVGLLEEFAQQGKLLCLIPGDGIDLPNYQNFTNHLNLELYWTAQDTTALPLGEITHDHWFIKGMFATTTPQQQLFKSVKLWKHYGLKSLNPAYSTLIQKANQEAFLINAQNTYVFSAGLDKKSSSLYKNELFVSAFLQMALSSAQSNQIEFPLFMDAIYPNKFPLINLYQVKGPEKIEFLWQAQGNQFRINDLFTTPGFYSLYHQDSLIDVLALNYAKKSFNPAQTPVFAQSNLTKSIITGGTPYNAQLEELFTGKKLTKYFLYLAIFALIGEIVIAILLKKV